MAKTRARNLGIGLGILALLGGSAAFLAVAGHRARALARQQVTFVAAVSHELRTPLAAIRSAGQNLADGVVSDPEQVRRYGAMVQREGERLTALVEQTLELSGMLGRGRSVRLEEVDPAHLVGEVLSEVRPREPVEVDVPSGLGPVVADGVALRSALRNLVDNALKHGAGQSVAVHARMAGMAGGPRELQLVVEDGGPGVPSGEAEHLFEPFYRGAAARQHGVPGSGLGLSLVRHVAEAHGGRVSVGAGPGGRGVAFTLHLPLASVETRAMSDTDGGHPPRARILLVEDEPALVLTLTDRLRAERYEVDAVSEGEVALASLGRVSYDLVLLDLMLRGSTATRCAASSGRGA